MNVTVETEFEEDSFEDEFEPEAERELERRTPKPKPMPGYRSHGDARHLHTMLHRSLNFKTRGDRIIPNTRPSKPATSGSSSSVASTSSATSAGGGGGASAAAAEASAPAASGDDEDSEDVASTSDSYVSSSLSARPLKCLAAQQLLQLKGKQSIQKRIVPSHLYSTLLAEAIKTRLEDPIVHLIATWPLPVLDLNELDIPLDSYLSRVPDEKSPCVADFMIKGLLYRKWKFCHLEILVLPKDTKIGSDVFGHFARIPYHYCSRLRNLRLQPILAAGQMKEGPKYLQEVPKIETKTEINFYTYMKGNIRVTILVPVGVIHWVGLKQNIADVHAALILQKHSPFVFQFDNLALINYVDTPIIAVILDLVVNPEKVKKILIKNKRVFRPDHVTYILCTVADSLMRFTSLRGFFTKLTALIGYGPEDNYQMKEGDSEKIAEVFRSWPNLTRLNFNDQPLDVIGSVPALINPIVNGLTKLSLLRCKLLPSDIKALSDSHHVHTLRLLRLDYNDLNAAIEETVELLTRLRSIQVLRMQACRVKYRNCLRCAESLAHSQTLRIWNFTDNVMYKLRHLKEFVELCSNIVSLRAIGCRPLDQHVLLGKVVVPSKQALSESKKRELDEFGESLNLLVF